MLFIYRSLINLIFPIIIIITIIRIIYKKEDKFRYREKLFSSSFNVKRNKDKRLIWFHVASIGELKSIVPIINKLNETQRFEFLITTVSLSSSKLVPNLFINQRNIFHRFFPYDKVNLVKSFLDKWKPDIILFVDSEIWPNFLFEINLRKIPLIMLNGRITKKTFDRWKVVLNFAKNNFNKFDLCLAASKESESYLKQLGAKNLKFFGNIKLADKIDQKEISNLNSNFLLQKKFWCDASTHKGEEIICIKTHC